MPLILGVVATLASYLPSARAELPNRDIGLNAPAEIKGVALVMNRENRLHIHYTLWCNVGVDQLSDVLTAISHPTRRAIIEHLANGPARFLDVAEPYDIALNAVSKHLNLLERAGLIEREKQGREVLISFRAEPLRQVASWVHEYERFWNQSLDQFQQHFRTRRGRGN